MRRKLVSVFCLFVCCLKKIYCLLYWECQQYLLAFRLYVHKQYVSLATLSSFFPQKFFCFVFCLASIFVSDIPYVLTVWPLQLHTRDL